MLGFTIKETMTGWHEYIGSSDMKRWPFEFTVECGMESLSSPTHDSDGGLVMGLSGTVKVGGLCHETKCVGTLRLRYLQDATVRYAFVFKAGDRILRYEGHKIDIKPWNLLISHTTCFGTVTDLETGKFVSQGVTYFRFHTLPSMLTSVSFYRTQTYRNRSGLSQ
jgi:hypothetical protein